MNRKKVKPYTPENYLLRIKYSSDICVFHFSGYIRLLCKRLIEERKRVGVIQYYNVLFIMELVSDKDIWALEQWMNGINNIYMKDIHNWCRIHFVKYHTVFVYRKEYPVKANIWNGYSYIRWRMERLMNLG